MEINNEYYKYQLNMTYFTEHISEIKQFVRDGYKIISIDPGYTNLIMIQDDKRNKLRYTNHQYLTESKQKSFKEEIHNLENKKMCKWEKTRYKNIKNRIKKAELESFQKFVSKFIELYGEKCILCIGDSGFNESNIKIIEYLKNFFPNYFVDESYTSSLCPICDNKMEIIYRLENGETRIKKEIKQDEKVKEIIRGLKACEFCHKIYNRDSVACENIITKIISIIYY
jgi:hypothetical protein